MASVESAADRASFFADFGEMDDNGQPALRWTSGAVTMAVPGHLHRGTVTLAVDDGADVLNSRATFHCAIEALPVGASPGQSVQFSGTEFAADYIVKSIEPDGTGMLIVLLEETVDDDVAPPGDGPSFVFSLLANSQYIALLEDI